MKLSAQKVIALGIFLMVLFPVWAHAGMALTDSGTGINRVVTVESSGQFRLVLDAAHNWGLSSWYDLVNDPSASLNLAKNPTSYIPEHEQGALFNQCINPNDLIGHIISAKNVYPSTARSMTIIENTSSRVVLENSYSPMITTAQNTDIVFTDRYYIYPDGKIYINHKLHSNVAQVLGSNPAWRNSIIGLGDPTNTTSVILPDTAGWIRATDTQNPYNWSGTTAKYLFAYWDSTNSGGYNNWTKASIMIVPKAGNPLQGIQGHHEWQGFKRWYYGVDSTINLSAGQDIIQEYMIQLGTQGSSVLPNITSSTVAGPIANAYISNPTPPAGSGGGDTQLPSVPTGLVSSNVTASTATISWSASTDNVAVTGYRVYRDGSLLSTTTSTSYADSGLSAATTYAYTVAAYDAAGNASSQSSTLTVTTSTLPIQSGGGGGTLKTGIMEYSTNTGATRSWIDSRFTYTIGGSVAPTGPQWMFYYDIYGIGRSTVNTLKAWAASNGYTYEDIFLHAKTNYTHAFVNPAYSQMDQFDVFEGSHGVMTYNGSTYTDRTSTAYSGSVTWSDINYIGYEEPFDIIKITRSAGAGITGVWEYWNGSTWATLTVTDGTSAFTTSGNVTFSPPSAWARTIVNGSRSKYFVRYRITAHTTYPTTTAIKGDNWLNASGANCRGWDATSGSIVNTGELKYNPTPPATALARFPYQARITFWASNNAAFNPGNIQSGVRTAAAFAAYQINTMVTSSGYNGIMCDDGEKDPTSDGIAPSNTDFGTGNWTTALVSRYQDIVTYVHNLNPAAKVGINAQNQQLVKKGDWNLAEYHTFNWKTNDIRGIPTTDSSVNMNYDNYLPANNANRVVAVMIYQDTEDLVPTNNPVATWDRGNRGPIVALSKHYIAANDYTYFSYYTRGGYFYPETDEVYLKSAPTTAIHQATATIPTASSVQRWATWFPAMGVDIGIPDTSGYNGGAYSLTWKSGTDVGGGNGVWRRDYTKAIVLHRPASWDTTATQYNTYSSSIALGGTYYPLNADGTTGTGVTTIALRTGEGAILMKAPISGNQPPPNDTTAPVASITSPANGATVNGAVTISAAASDNVAVTKVEFYENGVPIFVSNVAPYNYNWNSALVADGSCTLTVKAYDAADNVGQSSVTTIVSNLSDTMAPYTISDALLALQITVGIVIPTAAEQVRTDVAPVANGKSAPDGKVGIDDALAILSDVVGTQKLVL
jgi:hypothetical protein